ncbi:MAG: AbrB/MazE/SpoVT family DNA-binding domain-containing protein [Nanoarchaeota archaeon]
MMEIKARTKKWGNSVGVIIPKKMVREGNIKPNQEVTLMITGKPVTRGKDIAGKWKFSKSTDALMREVDKEFDVGF